MIETRAIIPSLPSHAGSYAESSQRLQACDEGSSIPSADIQDSFREFLWSVSIGGTETHPEQHNVCLERLFHASDVGYGKIISRTYYAYSPLVGDSDTPFTAVRHASFIKTEYGYEPKEVVIADNKAQDSSRLYLLSKHDSRYVRLDRKNKLGRLEVTHNGSGYLQGVMHHGYDGRFAIRGIEIGDATLKQVQQGKNVRRVTNYGPYDLTYHEKQRKLWMKRTEGGNTRDVFVIPIRINYRSIISRLFPETLLTDPLKSPPGQQVDPWSTANFLHVLGISEYQPHKRSGG